MMRIVTMTVAVLATATLVATPAVSDEEPVTVAQATQQQLKPPTPQFQVMMPGSSQGRRMSLSDGRSVAGACKTCTALCQTIILAPAGSYNTSHDIGGGMSPSQCIDQAQAYCSSGVATYLFNANCQL